MLQVQAGRNFRLSWLKKSDIHPGICRLPDKLLANKDVAAVDEADRKAVEKGGTKPAAKEPQGITFI